MFVYLSKMHNCCHKENMLNSSYIYKRWSLHFPPKYNPSPKYFQRDNWVILLWFDSQFTLFLEPVIGYYMCL